VPQHVAGAPPGARRRGVPRPGGGDVGDTAGELGGQEVVAFQYLCHGVEPAGAGGVLSCTDRTRAPLRPGLHRPCLRETRRSTAEWGSRRRSGNTTGALLPTAYSGRGLRAETARSTVFATRSAEMPRASLALSARSMVWNSAAYGEPSRR